jgi:hypothetical protein
MINSITNEPIRVDKYPGAWPYARVPLDQLDQVKKLLDHAGFRYSVDKYALSSDGEPYTVDVSFEHRAEVAALQAVFDDYPDPSVIPSGRPDGEQEREAASVGDSAWRRYNDEGIAHNQEGAMINSITNEPIRVSKHPEAWPYVRVPLDQLDQVKKLLDQAGLRYFVHVHAVAVDGEPYTVVVDFDHRVDVAAIQAVFDDYQDSTAVLSGR